MVWGLLLALPLIVIVALAVPGEEGAKPTVTEHLPFGPTGSLQLVDAENSFEPEMLAPLKVMVAPPFFCAVLVKIMALTLLLPTRTVPKFKKPFETFTTADTLGVGVAVGVGVGVAVGVGVGVGVAVGVGVGVEVGVDVGLLTFTFTGWDAMPFATTTNVLDPGSVPDGTSKFVERDILPVATAIVL
jgi:hypothetical protein